MTNALTSIIALLQAVYDEASGRVIVVDPPWPVLRELGGILDDRPDPPRTDVLLTKPEQRRLEDAFVLATQFAEFIDAGVLRIGPLEGAPSGRLLLAHDYAVAIVDLGRVIGIDTADPTVTDELFDHFARIADDGAHIQLSHTSRGTILESANDSFGPGFRDDFETALAKGEPAGRSIDPVRLSLLIGAAHGKLLYNVSRWGEAHGLASLATFSRRKTELEDHGHIVTEHVPQDVGRPRMRLRLGPSFDDDPTVGDFVAISSKRGGGSRERGVGSNESRCTSVHR